MACRLPGGIDSPERLWEALLRGDDLVTEIPPDRWSLDDYFDPEPGMLGRSVSKWGAFLDDVAGFDSEFFGIDDREATALDPQHRLLLETSWEVVEHAGIPPERLADSLTGVFVGLSQDDYQLVTAPSDTMEGPYGFNGNGYGMASGRIADALRVHGPAITLDNAGASSLLAVHMACRSLDDGESDLALAGGACVMLDPRRQSALSAQGLLSPTGRCRAFDAAADGVVSGEGAAMVLLKRLPDAVRDGDRILAVVRGTATNQGGRTITDGRPSPRAQSAVYRKALAAADVDAGTVGMVEAHGPGTPMGDPIEYASLAEVYGLAVPCALTSAKTNFGHTQSMAGVLGLMKTALALRHGVVPPNLHFTRLPDELARIDTRLFVPDELTPWTTNGGKPRRAAVSAYGLSGTNVHGVLEQAPAERPSVGEPTLGEALLFVFSANSTDGLRRSTSRLADWVCTHDDVALPDLAYTLARRRMHRAVRASVVACSRTELADALRAIADDVVPRASAATAERGPVWVFSGDSSQWAGMGGLLAREPEFAATVARAEPIILAECGFSVTEAMATDQPPTGHDRIHPTLFTMQVAIAAALKSYGAHPGAVIGHSVGETAAAVVSGALSFEDGLRVVCRRSALMSRIAEPGVGATAVVQLPAKHVLSELTIRGTNDVVVAVVSSPSSTVIAGAAPTIRELVTAWEQSGVAAREIPSDLALHSPQVDPIVGELTEALAALDPTTPDVPFYSATSYDPRDDPSCDARYWASNMRRMVRFSAAVRAAAEDGHRIFVELTPLALLTDAVDQTADGLDVPLATLAGSRPGQVSSQGLRPLIGELHCAGAIVDFSALYPSGRLVDAPLPTWTHRRLWCGDEGDESAARGDYTVSVHPLLGQHVRLPEKPERHVWQAEIGLDTHGWLGDHHIGQPPVFPASAYCEMALAAAGTVLGEGAEVRDVRFEGALPLDVHTIVSASTTTTMPGTLEFAVETDQQDVRVRHAAAVLHVAEVPPPPSRDLPELLAAHPDRENGSRVRERLNDNGIQHGPAFTSLTALHTGDDTLGTVVADIRLDGSIRSQQAAFGVHPALLDACFQSVAAHPAVHASVPPSPTHIRRLRTYGSVRAARYCLASIVGIDATGVEADVELLDQHGAVLLTVSGLRMATGTSADTGTDPTLGERLLSVEWRQLPLPALPVADAGSWLLVGRPVEDAMADELRDALQTHGAQCTTMNWTRGSGDSDADELGRHVRGAGLAGVVVMAGPHDGDTDAPGTEDVRDVSDIARALVEMPGETPRLYVVTRTAQSVLRGERPNLAQAGLRGLIRMIGNEHADLEAVHVDVDDTAGVAEQVARQLLVGSHEDETAWRGGRWYTARLTPAPLCLDDRRTAMADPARDGVRLRIRTPGDLDSIEMTSCERIPPAPGQIEVAIRAAGVDAADVHARLGTDFAGVVTAVGPGVTDHAVGDRVGGVSTDGCWGTFLTCDARLAVTLPAGLADECAAAVTTTHAAAYHGLRDLAHLAAGESVLIHSAAGHVGRAAIAIARAAGAEIFATAGSEARRELLRDMGVEHVYDSRSLAFVAEICRDTEGYGVDVVLNSLGGAARHASLELLAPGGRFVEIGKPDTGDDAQVGLSALRHNLTFCAVDLGRLAISHPARLRGVLTTVYRLTADGSLPLPQCTHVPMADAADAIRAMNGGRHTGKLVLDVPAAGLVPVVVPPAQARVVRRDGAYVVTGGLGRLGLFFAQRLAEAGAGRIVLCSRTPPAPNVAATIDAIRVSGADVVVQCGDVAEPDTARQLVATATASGLPVRGVLHAAAAGGSDGLDRHWATKVHGAWHLQEVTAGEPLDWFCCFSSVATLIGAPGQAARAAADSWLDAFARWRRGRGLPAHTIAWGTWDDEVFADDGAYAFDALLRHDRAHGAYGAVAGTPWLSALAERSPFAEAFRATRQRSTEARELREKLGRVPRSEWPLLLRRMLSAQVSAVVRRSIDPDRPLPECGIDSLGALELCTRIESATGVRIRATEINTIRDLAALLSERLAPVATA